MKKKIATVTVYNKMSDELEHKEGVKFVFDLSSPEKMNDYGTLLGIANTCFLYASVKFEEVEENA